MEQRDALIAWAKAEMKAHVTVAAAQAALDDMLRVFYDAAQQAQAPTEVSVERSDPEDSLSIAAASVAVMDALPRGSVVMDGSDGAWRKLTSGEWRDLDSTYFAAESAHTVAWQDSVPRIRVLFAPQTEEVSQ
ncbi:hypothetical protein [Microbacterium sp. 13-71-7]|uniref:hypothetical protein n=1 Tax=Microbacterium sp. 13-71-7 TaxID=1970399 RepID=UPI0025CD663C|nr:hypothetical protein [Microbacterium sp. 13-71-7]